MRRFENRVLVGLRTSIAKIISMWADPGTRWISSQQYRNENHKSIHSFSHVKRFGSSPHAPMTRTGSSEPSYPRSPRRNRRERPGLGRPKRGRAERLLADQRRPGRSNALPRGVDGSGRADALSTDILKHRRGPRRRPQHRVGGGAGDRSAGHSDALPGGVDGVCVWMTIALAANVLKNGNVVLRLSRTGEAGRHAQAKAGRSGECALSGSSPQNDYPHRRFKSARLSGHDIPPSFWEMIAEPVSLS